MAARDIIGVDQVLDITELPSYLQSFVDSEGDVWTSGPQGAASSSKRVSKRRSWANLFSSGTSKVLTHDSVMADIYGRRPKSVKQLGPLIMEMRSIKSPAEQRIMKLAGAVSGTAHAKVSRRFPLGSS